MKLDNLINKTIQKASDSNKDILLRYSQHIPWNEEHSISYMLNKKNMFYLKFPGNNKTIIGGNANAHKNKFNKYDIISNFKEDKILCFSIHSFDKKRESHSPWDGISREESLLPEITIIHTDRKTEIIFTILIAKETKKEMILEKINQELIDFKNHKININNKVASYKKIFTPNKTKYLKKIDSVLSELDEKSFTKIVLSKKEEYSFDKPLNIKKIIKDINSRYPQCYNFIYMVSNNIYFIGSTPEKLIEINKNKISSDAIAGTAGSLKGLYSMKNNTEHQYVIEYIKNYFNQICNLVRISKTKELDLGYTLHQKTVISGKLKKDEHILKILETLYPTPALAGNPKNKAIKRIREIEDFDRGYYGGALGINTNNGNGIYIVPIRSLLIRNDKIHFFSGSGIVKNSDSLKEWEETEIKLQHLKSIIGLK